MAREAHIIGEAVDIHGTRWDVRERRPTNHGFWVELGWPQGVPREALRPPRYTGLPLGLRSRRNASSDAAIHAGIKPRPGPEAAGGPNLSGLLAAGLLPKLLHAFSDSLLQQ